MAIKYLHTMVRVKHIDTSLNFYCNLLGLKEIRRKDNEQGKFTLIFLAPPDQPDAMIELTYNWDSYPNCMLTQSLHRVDQVVQEK